LIGWLIVRNRYVGNVYATGSGASKKEVPHHFGAGTGEIWLPELKCKGTETNLALCTRGKWSTKPTTTCVHDKDLSISCQSDKT